MELAGKVRRKGARSVVLNNGRIKARIEAAADGDGQSAVRVKVATQCPLDSYRRRGWITVEEWRAGEWFRDLCHAAAVGPQYARIPWQERVDTSRTRQHEPSGRQERARRALRRIEGLLGATPCSVLRSVLLERQSAAAWAKTRGFRETSGMDFLRDALASLVSLQRVGREGKF